MVAFCSFTVNWLHDFFMYSPNALEMEDVASDCWEEVTPPMLLRYCFRRSARDVCAEELMVLYTDNRAEEADWSIKEEVHVKMLTAESLQQFTVVLVQPLMSTLFKLHTDLFTTRTAHSVSLNVVKLRVNLSMV